MQLKATFPVQRNQDAACLVEVVSRGKSNRSKTFPRLPSHIVASVGALTFSSGKGEISFSKPSAIEIRLPVATGDAVTTRSTGAISFSKGVGALSFTHEKTRSSSFKEQLGRWGFSGVAAYGLLNTLYYSTALIILWVHVLKVPHGLGLAATAQKFVEVLGLTWAGSQVTKAGRAFAAVLLAPIVDRVLSTLQSKLNLKSQRAAFFVVVGACASFAAVVFGGLLLLWS